MKKAIIIEKLIEEKGYNLKEFAEKIDMPYTTLYGIVKNGAGRASMDNILKICKNLGIKTEELDEMAENLPKEEYEQTYEDIYRLITKNGKSLSTDEKMKLIKMLSEW